MQTLVAIWHRLKAIVLRRRLDRDLDEELSFHIAMRQADYVRGGIAQDRAAAMARRQFGNVTQFREQVRDMWTFPSFESLRQDAGYALRTLRRAPGFTIVAVTALAVGIGANTAIFSVIDAIRVRALPYPQADRLVMVWGNVQRAAVERRGASYPDFLDWRAQSTSFVDMAAGDSATLTLGGGTEPERVSVEFASAPYFSLLGVEAARGRTYTNTEDLVGSPNVVVLSDGLWKRRFGTDPQIVGQAVTLNATPYTVIGVMPPGFKGVSDRAEMWVPFALRAPPGAMAQRGSRGFVPIARLKPGVTLAAAQTEMDAISRQLERAYPDTNEKRGVELSPLHVELFGPLRRALFTLMAAVAFVLLIACANVANLLIARSEARRRELAVRAALGAGRGRLLRQLVTESCVLTILGALAGLVLARAAVAALIAQSPVTFPSFVAPDLDVRVAAFTVAVSLACGVLVGLAPGLQAQATDLTNSLKDSSRGSGGPRSQRIRSALVVAEVSLAVVLLVGAGLMIRSVRNLAALNPGFDGGSVLTLRASIPRGAPPPSAAAAAATQTTPPPPVVEGRTLLDRIRGVPGVAAATLGSDLPLDGGSSAVFYAAEGQPSVNAQNIPRTYIHRVTPDFFSTLRIPLLNGRTFAESEMTPQSPAVVVSERVVKRFWPGQDPIGKRVKFGSLSSNNPWMSIIGVVGEVKYRGLPENPTSDPDMYLPFLDRNQQVAIAVRTNAAASSLAASVRAAIRSADASIAIDNVSTMDELIGNQTAQSRFLMWLMGVFAAIALSLATIGIYGVMSYLVNQRTREIGIRLALGAAGGDILRLVVGNGARLITLGVVIGLAAAFALQRLVSSLLFAVTAADASSLAAVAVLAAVAFVACYLPAARATRVDPLRALRTE